MVENMGNIQVILNMFLNLTNTKNKEVERFRGVIRRLLENIFLQILKLPGRT